MTNSRYTRQRSLFFLYVLIHTRRTRNILFILYIYTHLNCRCYYSTYSNSSRFYGLRPYLRANILLSRHSNHKPSLCNPLLGPNPSSMNLRRVRRRQRNLNAILYISLPHPIYCRRTLYSTPSLSSPNRV